MKKQRRYKRPTCSNRSKCPRLDSGEIAYCEKCRHCTVRPLGGIVCEHVCSDPTSPPDCVQEN